MVRSIGHCKENFKFCIQFMISDSQILKILLRVYKGVKKRCLQSNSSPRNQRLFWLNSLDLTLFCQSLLYDFDLWAGFQKLEKGGAWYCKLTFAAK